MKEKSHFQKVWLSATHIFISVDVKIESNVILVQIHLSLNRSY